jgi:hypothetical protein
MLHTNTSRACKTFHTTTKLSIYFYVNQQVISTMLALGFEVLTSIGGAEKATKARREDEEDLLLVVGNNPCRDEKLEEGGGVEEW